MFKYLNEKIKKLDVLDIGLVKMSVLFATIGIVKLFPGLQRINLKILIILVLLCAARPFYKVWVKK